MEKLTSSSRSKIFILSLLTIFLCFLATMAISLYSLSKVKDASVQNEARLITATINAHIRDFLATQVSAAKTMAEDYFVKEAVLDDAGKPGLDPGMPVLSRFLQGLVRTTGIDSAFIVSDATRRYFSHQGLHKVIAPDDAGSPDHEHDIWYPAFVGTGLERNVQIDTNPVEKDEWTIFFNNRIAGDDGRLLGVCGVGIGMNRLQSLLLDLEKQYGVEIFLENETRTSQIGSRKVFFDKRNLTLAERAAAPESISFLRTGDNGWQCSVGLIQFGWDLVVAQPSRGIVPAFSFFTVNDILLFLCSFGLMAFFLHRINSSEKEMLAKIARIDPLTGLENRSAIDRVTGMLKDGCRPGSLFIFDVDSFKTINDTMGHPIGDILLQRIAGILQSSFRKSDVISRIGGDEFMVFSPGLQGDERIDVKAQRLKNAVQGIRHLREGVSEASGIATSISMGVALFPQHGSTYTELYNCADTALYHAKAAGKNRYVIYDASLVPEEKSEETSTKAPEKTPEKTPRNDA
ncbi:MAG: GGDEF domain-containing protein [Desulfovibrio sp.]|nr:GGDEF domain-containing protein [Desulfovibrio sp.]